MAAFLTSSTLSLFLVLFKLLALAEGKFSQQFPETKAVDKASHLHFYFHDIVSGKRPTAIRVAGQKNRFGSTTIMDDPLTEGMEPGSKVVGRAQGMYTTSSLDALSIIMVMNLEFLVGKYNGSTLSILGRNPYLERVREMPIVGGTGLFRFARGYVQLKARLLNAATGDAVVEYDVFAMHH